MENLWKSSLGQSVEITQKAYIRTYKYKEKGGYTIAIRPRSRFYCNASPIFISIIPHEISKYSEQFIRSKYFYTFSGYLSTAV